MNEPQFQAQMSRLIETFGVAAYKPERVRLIWREVNQRSAEWFTRLVDRFVGSSRQAPLLPEFRDAAAEEAEREWASQKRTHAKEAFEAMHYKFGADDKRTLAEMIQSRLNGKSDDAFWEAFLGGLKTNTLVHCRGCDDVGLIWYEGENATQWPYRCTCAAGARQSPRLKLYTAAPSHHRRVA